MKRTRLGVLGAILVLGLANNLLAEQKSTTPATPHKAKHATHKRKRKASKTGKASSTAAKQADTAAGSASAEVAKNGQPKSGQVAGATSTSGTVACDGHAKPCALSAAIVAPSTPPIAPAASPIHPMTQSLLSKTMVWADYKVRVSRVAHDRVPALVPDSIDSFAVHRIRVGAFAQITPKFGSGLRITSRLARLGDFDAAGGTGLKLPEVRFDQIYLGYHYSPQTLINIGRGGSRAYEADLVVGTGRFDEDDFNADSITVTHNYSKETTAWFIYSPTFSTNLQNPGPRFTVQAAAFGLKHDFDPDTTLHFFGGALDPRRPIFYSGGEKPFTQAMLRLDHRFDPSFSAFASGSWQFSHTDGTTFLDLPNASTGDRTAFFGGLAFGNADHAGENEWDLYYTKTGAAGTSLVAEWAAGIEETRVMFQRQMVPEVRLTASLVHKTTDTLAAGVKRDDTDTAYIQLFAKF